jgi:precorrin-2 dehydrogenase / sirohydrochlorin ferrochelatase
MHENNRENIHASEIKYMNIALLSSKVRILVVGGGKAGFIKAKSFASKGCMVEIVSKSFTQEFKELESEENVKLIKGEYNEKYIKNKHLIVIASDNEELNQMIVDECERDCKLYLSCSDFTDGNFINPLQRETHSTRFSIHTKKGSPKTSAFIANIVEDTIKEYDGFVDYVCNLREEVKTTPCKNQVMEFVNTEDFYVFYKSGIHTIVLKMFFGGSEIED